MARIAVVGSGILGLAAAARLARHGHTVSVLEKERDIGLHQTGRNSGVIHSGVYYPPGSLKARLSTAGAHSMAAYARERGVTTQTTGKIIVATRPEQLAGLRLLAERAERNGVPGRIISPAEARELEPHVHAVAALHIESTGIVDYVAISRALVADLEQAGGELRLSEAFVAARSEGPHVTVETSKETLRVDVLLNCAGLHSDRVAEASGLRPDARIVPFRGEYYELVPERSYLVTGLIYPVPDPRFPFLGVHLTKMVDGTVHAGPNAVLALAREGYTWSTVNGRDVRDALSWSGLWRLGARSVVPGVREVVRSLSRRAFAASLAELVPAVRVDDLVPSTAGVRAQALQRDGRLVDDFLIQRAPRQVHVLNAPSPAATASLEIAKHLQQEVDAALA